MPTVFELLGEYIYKYTYAYYLYLTILLLKALRILKEINDKNKQIYTSQS